MSDVALAVRHGATVSVEPWNPGGNARRDIFWFFELSQYPGSNTPTGSGLIGYFGVNRWNGDVIDANSDIVQDPALAPNQTIAIQSHCLGQFVSTRHVDIAGERF
jgi:hypothetical protein